MQQQRQTMIILTLHLGSSLGFKIGRMKFN